MPAIKTSSDLYQNRNQGLTTYKKNLNQNSLAQEMVKVQDKTPARAVEKAVVKTQIQNKEQLNAHQAGQKAPATQQAQRPQPAQRTESYAPLPRTKAEHNDRHSFITGGTVDMRA